MNINIGSIVKMAFQSILSNKLRTFLTMLGIIIGVFSVIVLVSIGQGATAGVTNSISSMGSNIISVSVTDRRKNIKYDDIYELEKLDGVKNVTPVYSSRATVKFDLETADNVSIVGGNESYLNINNYEVEEGRAITPIDVDYRNAVAVIGQTTVKNLFGTENPINQVVSVKGEKYTIVGVLKSKESSITGDSNDVIIVPVTTLMRQNKTTLLSSFTVQAKSAEDSAKATQNVKDFLLKYFGDEDSYRVFSQDQLLSVMNEATAMLTAMLGGIAGISLLVGGIGIMNIMLVTVTERTREIGIRKAIGAGRSNILIQFLIESSVISGIGGFIGVALGIIVSNILSSVLDLEISVNLAIIVGAFIFSLIVGVFFGLYPANKASKLRPVDALQYE